MAQPERDPTARKLLIMQLAAALACLIVPGTFCALLATTMDDTPWP